jgi:glycosyltransferase involved in cell wall biosynthesis
MRILHISTRLILGGSQENTILSCEGQARLGHRVHLAYGPILGPEGSLLDRVLAFNQRCAQGAETTHDGRAVCPITTHVVHSLVREVSPRTDRRCLEELRELVRTLLPDVVHTHSSKAGILGRIAAWDVLKELNSGRTPESRMRRRALLDRPESASGGAALKRGEGANAIGIVHTIHGPPFMPIEGSLARRIKTRLLNGAYTLSEWYAAKRCHAIVSVADAMTRTFLRRGIGQPALYRTVYSGMEVERFTDPALGALRDRIRRGLGVAQGDTVIGTVARLAEHKGHDDLLTALADHLRERSDLKLLWVGDGWWRERLTQRAAALGLRVDALDVPRSAAGGALPVEQPHIILTGLVPPGDIPTLMHAMDVLAHPSLREGLPRTVPQALLCGVCPVAYDADGTREVCREMETGRLVPVGDVDALREAILWCIENPPARGVLALRGREWCLQRFSAAQMVAELEKVYAEAISARR